MSAKRIEPYLKLACLCLGVLIILQLTQRGRAHDPLRDLRIITPPPDPAASDSSATKPAQKNQRSRRGNSLPPEVASLVERINNSQAFAPIQQPQPIQLLGLAGGAAFIQDPNGQLGLANPGETFNGIKLLEIGINRVLIEHEGVEKELTLFSGIGSESLMKKDHK